MSPRQQDSTSYELLLQSVLTALEGFRTEQSSTRIELSKLSEKVNSVVPETQKLVKILNGNGVPGLVADVASQGDTLRDVCITVYGKTDDENCLGLAKKMDRFQTYLKAIASLSIVILVILAASNMGSVSEFAKGIFNLVKP